MISCAVLVALPVLAAVQAPAPSPSPSDSPAPLPTPASEAKKLDFLAGDWIHAEK
jgi:hypothetical protein